MLYMVIERFKGGAAPKIYGRFREKGRMMPEGLEYISSWIDYNLKLAGKSWKPTTSCYSSVGSTIGKT